MGTPKQKRVAKRIVENLALDKPETSSAMLENVGYSKSMARHRQKDILESKGVKEELKILGFDEDTAKGVVSDILVGDKTQDKDKLKAADMIFKVHGTYAPEKKVSLNVSANIKKKHEDIAKKYEEDLRDKILE